MAIIPRYSSRALPPGAQSGLIESAQARGRAGAGLALAAGDAIVAGVGYKRRRDAGKADALKSKIADGRETVARQAEFGDLADAAGLDAELALARAGGVAAGRADGGAAGLAARRLAKFDGQAKKSLVFFKDRPALKQRADDIVASHARPYEARLLKMEAALRPVEEAARLDRALGLFAEAARLDPAGVDGYIGRGLKALEEAGELAGLPPENIAEKQNRFAGTAATAAVRGLIERDPADALARLDAGAFDARFQAPDLELLRGEAQAAARARAARDSAAERARRRALALDMEDHLAALAETGRGDEAVDARARATLPEVEYAAFQAGEAAARERYATRAEYAFLTAEEIAADIAARAAGDGPSDSGERHRAHAIRTEIRDEVLAARAADPAAWAMRDEDVAAAFAAAEENPESPALARKAAELRLALQREMGVERPRLLSEAERDGIAEQLAAKTPTERRAELHSLWKRQGSDYGRLVAELDGQVDADTLRLARYAMQPRFAEPLAKGMEKARADGPVAPEGEASLVPLTAASAGAYTGIDMSRFKPFRQYVMPDGERMAYDGEALVPVAAAQVTASHTLPGGATLWPGSKGQTASTDWSRLLEQVPKLSVRAGLAAAGTAVAVLTTPLNAQEEYHYFGDGARLRTAPGDLFGTVQQRDPDTGEWLETDLIGFIVSAGAGALPSVVAGTPAQVERARPESFSLPDGRLPPPPGLIPPVVPDTGRERFPAERSAPVIHATPANPGAADTEVLPIPEGGEPQILIFPDMSKDLIPYMASENRKGNAETKDQLDYIRDRFLETYPDWEHVGGGRHQKKGTEESEHWVPGPGSVFLNEEGRKGDGRPGGKWADLTFKSPSGTLVHVQTVDVDKYGKPTERELENAEAIRRAIRQTVILIPKPARR